MLLRCESLEPPMSQLETRSFGDVGSMSGLLKSGHGWAIVHALAATDPSLSELSRSYLGSRAAAVSR
jgi:hypothetical protein